MFSVFIEKITPKRDERLAEAVLDALPPAGAVLALCHNSDGKERRYLVERCEMRGIAFDSEDKPPFTSLMTTHVFVRDMS